MWTVAGSPTEAGSRTVNVEPRPWMLSTVRSPPIRRQKWRLIASPRPVPPYVLLVDGLGLGERLEEPPELLLGHPDPGVGDGERDGGILLGVV